MTVILVTVAGTAELVAMAAMLSDPGPGGDTPEFQNAKALGALAFFLIPIVGLAIGAAIHVPVLKTRRAIRRATATAT